MNVKLPQKILETHVARRDNIGDVMYTLLITMDEIAVIKITCILGLASQCVEQKTGNK